MAPIYGMAASIPFRGMVDDILRRYMDLLYKVPKRPKRPQSPGAPDQN
jgi:hypothetical protein